jgi:putative oxidoreductase
VNGLLSLGLLVVRLAAGIDLAAHGYYKFFGEGGTGHFAQNLAGMGVPMPEVSAVLSAGAELGGGILLILGLLTRFAGAVVAFNMLVAIYLAHRTQFGLIGTKDGTGVEYATLLLSVAVLLLCAGAGRYSIDGAIRAGRARSTVGPV